MGQVRMDTCAKDAPNRQEEENPHKLKGWEWGVMDMNGREEKKLN